MESRSDSARLPMPILYLPISLQFFEKLLVGPNALAAALGEDFQPADFIVQRAPQRPIGLRGNALTRDGGLHAQRLEDILLDVQRRRLPLA